MRSQIFVLLVILFVSPEMTDAQTADSSLNQLKIIPISFHQNSPNGITANLTCNGVDFFHQPAHPVIKLNDLESCDFKAPTVFLPTYTQGAFCNFEDHINRNRKLYIDLGVK